MQLYLHLPFCSSRCRYCDFYSTVTTSNDVIIRYIDALAGEWSMRCKEFDGPFDTLFIGGGTPSVLTVAQWEYLTEKLLRRLDKKADAEWTVECNPDSFTDELSSYLSSIGVNRITFGVQTLDDRERRFVQRRGSAAAVEEVLQRASLRYFRSIGADLIYGLPGQAAASFKKTLQTVLQMPNVHHLSAYELTIADSTPFGRHQSILPLPSDDSLHVMMEVLQEEAGAFGFEQYEVSNFARPGHRCRHNIGYWNHVPYCGLGAAAHSYNTGVRFWNTADLQRYCSRVECGKLPVEGRERIDASLLAKEILFLGLRQTCGVDEEHFRSLTGKAFTAWADRCTLDRLVKEGYIEYHPPFWRPTRKGLYCADYCARELFG